MGSYPQTAGHWAQGQLSVAVGTECWVLSAQRSRGVLPLFQLPESLCTGREGLGHRWLAEDRNAFCRAGGEGGKAVNGTVVQKDLPAPGRLCCGVSFGHRLVLEFLKWIPWDGACTCQDGTAPCTPTTGHSFSESSAHSPYQGPQDMCVGAPDVDDKQHMDVTLLAGTCRR